MKINILEIQKRIEEVEKDLELVNQAIPKVYEELKRQRSLYHVQRHSNLKWLPILLEEVGEVAECLQNDTKAAKVTDADNLYTELVQVAAVAVSWLAQLEEQRIEERR